MKNSKTCISKLVINKKNITKNQQTICNDVYFTKFRKSIF